MLKTLFFTAALLSCTLSTDGQNARASSKWMSINSEQELWEQYPNRIRLLIDALDLKRKELEQVQRYAEEGDTVAACKALLRHYKQSDAADWLLEKEIEGDKPAFHSLAALLLKDSIYLREAQVRMPETTNGGWKWDYQGPYKDAEFGYSLNGHKYLVALLSSWIETKNDAYVRRLDTLIRDWVIHNPLPPPEDSIYLVLASTSEQLDWRDIDEVIWRTLEAGNRLGVSWPQVFYHFQTSHAFTPAARLLMLSSLVEQARYLQIYHKQGHNWTTMEMNGLALAGLTFPEFREANEWASYAMKVMETEIHRQVYPDGLQTELSSKTQWVALQRFESLARHFQLAGRHVEDGYMRRVEDMYHFLAYSMRPDGHQALNNDADREDLRPRILKAADIYERADWLWIASNGKQGEMPQQGPSLVFPWGGIHIMRSGWNAQAHWAFFDTGPYGTGHQHRDMLHLSISAYGKDLLVDGGRYTHKDYFSFDPTNWRGYFRSSFSHNTILVDGKGQKAGPVRTDSALTAEEDYFSTAEFDFARGHFVDGYEDTEGEVMHSRAVLYLKDNYWLVLDQLVSDRPRNIQALWHFAPSCEVQVTDEAVQSVNVDEANLTILPVGEVAASLDLSIIKGQETPVIQGWYSGDYGSKVPNSTAVYSQTIQDSTSLAWILLPWKGKQPKMKASIIHEDAETIRFQITVDDQDPTIINIPKQNGKPRIGS